MLQGKVAVVTGASDGLGKLISERLAGKGVYVVGVARRENLLQDLQKSIESRGGRFSYIAADMTAEESIDRIVRKVYDNFGGAEILVNNAGVFEMDYFTRISRQKHRTEIMLNLAAPIELYQSWMLEYKKRSGENATRKPETVLWMNSVSGLRPYGGNSVYEATKYGLKGFVLDQRAEQKHFHDHVKNDERVGKELGAFRDVEIRHINVHPDSGDTSIILRTEGNLFADPKNYDYIPAALIADVCVGALEKDSLAYSDDIEIGIRETEGRKKIYAIFYPLDQEGNPDLNSGKMHFLADYKK